MHPAVHGIHHVTCIAGDAQENIDFYTGTLGMRLVKKSVNQDATDTYHFFYADGAGTPGTDITFFPWPHLPPARPGAGLTIEVALGIPPGSIPYWRARLEDRGVACGAPETRFGDPALPVADPHGLPLVLVETDDQREFVPWERSPVPVEHQIRGVHAVRVWVRELEPTARVLTEVLGLTLRGRDDGWHRYGADDGVSGKLIEVQERPDAPLGRWGTGGVHHVAWRTRDVAHEMALRGQVLSAGLYPTGLIDRFWFQSVYFREPGGVLFELATDGPGFAVDEDPDRLGEQLILPPWLEPDRARIEASLPPLRPPSAG